jgi:AAA+ ATPase superfamily predicted ATPase
MNYFYPQDQQNLFTDRETELGQLKHALQSFKTGPAEHIALFGLRRVGKTLLLKELIRQVLETEPDIAPAYLDFSALCSSPENFVLGYIGSICYWLFEKGQSDPEAYLNANTLPVILARHGADGLLEDIQPILQELARAKPDRQALLRQAFRFPREVVSKRKTRLALVFDEFQEIQTLENFPESRNVLSLFRAEIQTQTAIVYFLAGSAITILSHLISHPDSPLFAQFTRMAVEPFPRSSSRLLVEKLITEPLDADIYPLIHSLTVGHPFYITALSRRLSYLIEVVQRPADQDTVKQAFLIETLAPGGRIYDFCRYVYDLSLQKASGYGSLKAVLQILATEDGLTATQIARRLRVTSATASDYLRWLCEVDLIQVKDHIYSFHDPVLRFWVGNIVKGIELSLTAEPWDLKALITRLDTQFQRVSEELGTAQESLVRELMRSFNGQVVEGRWFGSQQTVRLPIFSEVNRYQTEDGQVELDVLATVSSGNGWIVEVKWKNKGAGKKELAKLVEHAQDRKAQGWYISKAGFTSDALSYAMEQGVYVSDEAGLQELKKVLSK